MTEKSGATGAITHFRRLSWQSRLTEAKPIIVFFLMAFMVGIVAGMLGPLLYHMSLSVYVPVCFVGGLLFGMALVFSARLVDRKLFGAVKHGILAVEDRIMSGNTRTQMEDLEKLVAGYLKLKRMEAADYYSRQLLALSNTGGTSLAKLSDWMVTTECWVSTDQYQRGWNYKLIWLFETRGVLTLSPNRLDFQSRKINFSCNPSNIVSLEIKTHPFWMKPIPMRYISMTIDEMGQRHTFHLTPSFGQTDTVWDCNKMVDVWFARLQKVKNSMNPAGAFPDWLKDVQAN